MRTVPPLPARTCFASTHSLPFFIWVVVVIPIWVTGVIAAASGAIALHVIVVAAAAVAGNSLLAFVLSPPLHLLLLRSRRTPAARAAGRCRRRRCQQRPRAFAASHHRCHQPRLPAPEPLQQIAVAGARASTTSFSSPSDCAASYSTACGAAAAAGARLLHRQPQATDVRRQPHGRQPGPRPGQ